MTGHCGYFEGEKGADEMNHPTSSAKDLRAGVDHWPEPRTPTRGQIEQWQILDPLVIRIATHGACASRVMIGHREHRRRLAMGLGALMRFAGIDEPTVDGFRRKPLDSSATGAALTLHGIAKRLVSLPGNPTDWRWVCGGGGVKPLNFPPSPPPRLDQSDRERLAHAVAAVADGADIGPEGLAAAYTRICVPPERIGP